MRRLPHFAILVAGVGLGCAAATAVSPIVDRAAESILFKDRPSLARAVSASGLRRDVARRDLLVDAACSAAAAARR